MKFLCDRCKTRYSIGDERVRGKILKIRCKNCANVITVREGMPNPDAAEAAPAAQGLPRRVQKTTIAAPAVQSEAPAPPAGGPGAAVEPAPDAPPPALEEEWYVSIDGEQVGPFSLGDAQRWVAGHPADADLHCWNEGFDDWLPVDKVRHFRGLRRKPAATPAPVPVLAPRVPTPARPAAAAPAAAVRPAPRPPSEDEPKPLFAATMAQLEKDSAPSDLRGLGMAGPGAPSVGGSGSPLGTSPGLGATGSPLASPLRTLGTPTAGRPLNGHVPMPARPNGAALQARATPVPAFDASEPATQLEAPAFDPGLAASIAPGAGADANAAGDGFAGDDDDDDDLDIGEVSRVVKLADLAQQAGVGPQPAVAARPGAVNRPGPEGARLPSNRTGPAPRLGAPVALGDGGAAMAFAAGPLPAAAVSHRRGMIALIAGAIVLVGVAVAVVFFFVLSDQEEAGSGLGRVDEIDTTRPDVVRPAGSGAPATATPADPPPNPFVPPKPRTPVAPVTPPPPDPSGGGNKLEAREIEEMAGKNSSVTQRCYMRAQRGADGILLGDVKKIAVTLTISGDGAVTDAQLSDNQAASSLGKCLLTSIRSWKFRASPGGTFRFVLHFG